ncbi:hypothetical protein [Aequorivita sp. Q41]|uniref:hypothetical protein n=1 Tax=Aequorivita sp. Q41 TaxID=3153300 RepID=UPI003241D481
MLETQKKYKLKIPFGHNPGDATSHNRSKIIRDYNTGGTLGFLFIDQHDTIVFSDFHLNTKKAITVIKTIK